MPNAKLQMPNSGIAPQYYFIDAEGHLDLAFVIWHLAL